MTLKFAKCFEEEEEEGPISVTIEIANISKNMIIAKTIRL